MNGDFIKEWESAVEASESLLINPSSVARCCNGFLTRAGSYVWRYKDNNTVVGMKVWTPPTTAVLQFTLDGVFVTEYPSQVEARAVVPAASHISDACRGAIKSSGGFKWKYKEV